MSYLFNDLVGFKGNAVDAFHRLRVSQPFTIFDSQHRYQFNSKWDTFGVSGGTANYVLNESAVNLIVGATLGSKVTRETKRVFPYQPGKSLLILNTFAFNTPREGLKQRIGYFGLTGGATSGTPYNGVYLQQDGLTLSICLVSGSLNTTTTVNQSNWNGDKFDGSGGSERLLDVSKTNIFWTDIEWLGVGDVRVGFFVDGSPVVAHTFHNDNINSTTYMTTACLPIRYEIENTGTTYSENTMKQICSTVMSEAGFQGFNKKFNINKGFTATTLTTAGTEYPFMAIRLPSTRLDGIIIPAQLNAVLEETASNKPDTVQYKILLNPTITGGGWTAHSNHNVEYNTGMTGITGGTELIGGYISSSGSISVTETDNFNYQIGRNQTGQSDVICVAFIPVNSGAKIYADLSWYELL